MARFELVPLEELGRPRVDVLCNMSGIFRDSFQNVVELLDDLFQRAAAAEEPQEMNYVRKHAGAMEQQVGAGAGVACVGRVLVLWGLVWAGRLSVGVVDSRRLRICCCRVVLQSSDRRAWALLVCACTSVPKLTQCLGSA